MTYIFLASLSYKMKEIMNVLPVIATIFIVEIYGMNLDVRTESEWPWGYPLVMSLMLILAIGMLWVCRKKNWI